MNPNWIHASLSILITSIAVNPIHDLSRGSGPGFTSPTGSFRSSSRFFSFLGTTFSSRWERPPPTYDEAMKHVNPDTAREASSRNPTAFLFLHGYINLKVFHLVAKPEPDLNWAW